jgi:hypothetical protein
MGRIGTKLDDSKFEVGGTVDEWTDVLVDSGGFGLRGDWRELWFRGRMEPGDVDGQDGGIGQRTAVPRLSRPAGPRGRSSRDLVLVKFSFWAVVILFLLLIALVLWGLATHEPSQLPDDFGD